MKTYVPDYYTRFHCPAGGCRHTCCAGWEIGIDDDSLDFYRSLPGRAGEEILEKIAETEEGAHFVLTEEHCPFLQRDGKCRLIIEYGEDILCDICADHPRFRNYLCGREEIGLGMCCEEAARLILSQREPVRLVQLDDDMEDDTPDAAQLQREKQILQLCEELTAAAQDRTLPLTARIAEIGRKSGTEHAFRVSQTAAFLKKLEFMDTAWQKLLSEAETLTDEEAKELLRNVEKGKNEIPLEQFLVYLLFRHIPEIAEEGDAKGHAAFCTDMWCLTAVLCGLREREREQKAMDEIIEICRLFSSEIEYSDENPQRIMEFCRPAD